jgi:hypothetical protein
VQGLGAFLIIIGILFGISGIGSIIGIPLIIVGLVMFFAPNFTFIAIIAYLISLQLGTTSLTEFIFIFITISLVGGFIQLYIQNQLINKINQPIPTNSEDQRLCPYCGELIKSIAMKCKHCHSVVEPISTNKQLEEQIEEQEQFTECPICEKKRLNKANSCECGFIFVREHD